MFNLKPKDLIAVLIIIGMIIFKLTGHNGTLDTTVALIIGYYFAKRETNVDNGK